MATFAELTASCEGNEFGVALVVSLCVPYHALTVSLHMATFAQMKTICEGSRFGFALVALWFPCVFLTMPLLSPAIFDAVSKPSTKS